GQDLAQVCTEPGSHDPHSAVDARWQRPSTAHTVFGTGRTAGATRPGAGDARCTIRAAEHIGPAPAAGGTAAPRARAGRHPAPTGGLARARDDSPRASSAAGAAWSRSCDLQSVESKPMRPAPEPGIG